MFKFFMDVTIHDLFTALASGEVQHPPLIIPENSQYNIIKAYFNTTIDKIKKSAQNGLGGIDNDKFIAAIRKITSSIPSDAITKENKSFLATLAQFYDHHVNLLEAEEKWQAAAEQIYNFDQDENEYDVMKAREIMLNCKIGREISWAMAAKIEEQLNASQQEDAKPHSQGCILQ